MNPLLTKLLVNGIVFKPNFEYLISLKSLRGIFKYLNLQLIKLQIVDPFYTWLTGDKWLYSLFVIRSDKGAIVHIPKM